jgi:hypothetical protein
MERGIENMIKRIALLITAASSVFAASIPSFNGEQIGPVVASAASEVRFFNSDPNNPGQTLDVFAGWFQQAAVRRPDNNLDIWYQFDATGELPLPIAKAEITAHPYGRYGQPGVTYGTRTDFSGTLGDAQFQADGTVPVDATEANQTLTYLTLMPSLQHGDHTSAFVLRTNSPAYSLGDLYWISEPYGPLRYQYLYTVAPGSVIRPDVPEVPEPATFALMGIPLAVLVIWRKRRGNDYRGS